MRSVLMLMLLACGAARAEVAVLTTGAFKAVAVAVAGPFEAAGQPVRITNDTAGGVLRMVRGGAAFDVLVLTAPALRTMADEGKVVPDSRVDLARVGVGVAVREGAGREASPTMAIIDSQTAKGAQKGALRWIRPATMRARRSWAASATC